MRFSFGLGLSTVIGNLLFFRNECLMTPQHEKQIGYWVSEKGKCMKWLYH